MRELCQLAADWRGTIPADGVMLEEKKDGWRALRFPGIDGKVRLWTRNGHPIEGAGHILHRLALMEQAAGEPMVFDGEFQVGGTLAATKAWCERGWRTGGEAGTFYAFDCLTLAEWRAGGADRPLHERKAQLQALSRVVDEDPALSWEWRAGSRGRDESGCVQVLADGWAFTAHDAVEEARRVWAAGGEGVMLKDAESPYRRNRNDAWQKVKAENAHKWLRHPIAA
jgi:ATP-dependent DNA ligase